MRKKQVNHLADTIFWYLIYFMPAIIYGIICATHKTETLTLAQFFETYGFGLTNGNIITITINQIFGADGILPLVQDIGIIYVISWFGTTMLLHLLIDFILFIPRLAHNFMEKFTRTGD